MCFVLFFVVIVCFVLFCLFALGGLLLLFSQVYHIYVMLDVLC